MGNVKLKDIPEALNVSTVTVSNALAGRKGVSEEVRSQVVAKAKELGYDLKKYTNKRQGFTIGVIVSEQCLELGVSFYWSMYQKIAYAASKIQSVTMLKALGQENEEKEILPKIVRDKSVDGLIVVGWIKEQYIQKLVSETTIPSCPAGFCDT